MREIIDNFDVFPRDFKTDEFYFIQVIIRGKDHPGKVGTNGANNARTIREYSLYNEEQLVRYQREIKEVSDMYGARVYMRPAKRNKFKIAAKMVEMLGQYLHLHKHQLNTIYAKAVGQDTGTERLWIVDVDNKTEEEMKAIISHINIIEPTDTVLYYLPTLNGWHIITKPFNVTKFGFDCDIHKNNPTLLYYNPQCPTT